MFEILQYTLWKVIYVSGPLPYGTNITSAEKLFLSSYYIKINYYTKSS